MTDTASTADPLDAAAFFARYPHLDRNDSRFEYACGRREYVESLAAAQAVAPRRTETPFSAVDAVWAHAFAVRDANNKPAPAPFSSAAAAALWRPTIDAERARQTRRRPRAAR